MQNVFSMKGTVFKENVNLKLHLAYYNYNSIMFVTETILISDKLKSTDLKPC